jgi:putative peptidoglycan lipid II flippase
MINSDNNRQIARAALTVMFAFVLGNLAGLIRQILVTNAFGTQADIEAFNAANRVSETLFNLVAGGALASAFIPTFTSLISKEKHLDAWKLASSIANLLFLILLIVSIFSAIFAPWIVRNLLAPGFINNPEKEILTIRLLRLMLPSAVIFGLSGLVMGILNSNQIFLFPALAPSMYQLGLIIGVLFLSPKMGIFGLAWGVIIGSGLHLLLQIPILFRLRGKYYLTLGLGSEHVTEVFRLIGPRLLGVAVVQLNFWINTRLASQFIEGSVTSLVLAFTLMLMPQAAIAQSIAIAAMPTFSALIALDKRNEMQKSLAASLRASLLLAIPAGVGLILLRKPIISLLYQRGQFDAFSTDLVAWALLWYASGLVGHSLVEILSRAFYSLHDTKTPVTVGVIAMSLNVILSYVFSSLFLRIGWMPHGGLALANTIATALEAVGLLIIMRIRIGGLNGKYIIAGVLKTVVATAGMTMVLVFWMGWTNLSPSWIITLGGILIGGCIFGIIALFIRLEESILVIQFAQNRLSNMISK